MVGSLSLFSPGSIQGYGTSSATQATAQATTAQSLANDGSAVCASLDCGEHGAFNRAQLQAQFPGLTLFGGEASQAAQPTGFAPRRTAGEPAGGNGGGASGTPSGGSVATGGGRLAGATLLTAQEQGQQSGDEAKAAGDLSEEEQAQVSKLKQIDAKVRAHERAHAAAGGAHAGAPSYTYTRGPDGQMYATGGEVAIDISAESDPEATLQKAAQVAAAALAPADPSGQDRAVAAAAAQLRLQALAQIREEKRIEQEQQEAERAESRAAQESAQGSAQESVLGGERGQQSGIAAEPGPTQGIPGQATGASSGDPASDPGAAQARIAAANRQLGRLVGLTA